MEQKYADDAEAARKEATSAAEKYTEAVKKMSNATTAYNNEISKLKKQHAEKLEAAEKKLAPLEGEVASLKERVKDLEELNSLLQSDLEEEKEKAANEAYMQAMKSAVERLAHYRAEIYQGGYDLGLDAVGVPADSPLRTSVRVPPGKWGEKKAPATTAAPAELPIPEASTPVVQQAVEEKDKSPEVEKVSSTEKETPGSGDAADV